jgi:CheY-like chemotaxis protein
VLVIEDDANDRKWILQTLSGAGYAVEAVATGAAALGRVAERAYDVITLDLLLPDMTGRDVLGAIRTSEPNRDTPVVVVTVLAEKGIVAGFQVHDILTKPVPADELIGALDRASVVRDGKRPILVVDDDAKALKLAESALKRSGYRPVCVKDAAQGLAKALEDPPAAVVLDLLMPGMSGFEFLHRLRRRASGHKIAVIVWTEKDLSGEERAQLMAQAQAVVQKTDGPQALLDELKSFVSAPVPHGKSVA